MARSSSSSSSSSSWASSDSGSGSGTIPVVVPPFSGGQPIPVGRNTSGDSCSHYRLETSQTCRQPRSCYDCLNVELSSAEGGCVLNGVGACQAIELYIPSRDFRADRNDTPLSFAYMNYFPSVDASYCQPTDAACARCTKIAASTGPALSDAPIGSWNGSREDVERFCVGADGCVCLAACEADSWTTAVQEDCSTGGDPNAGVMYPAEDTYRTMLPLFMAIQIALIIMVVHRQRVYGAQFCRRPPRPQEEPYNANAIASPSNRLQLTGWRRMQAELVQREKAQRGLVSLMSPRNANTNDSDNANTNDTLYNMSAFASASPVTTPTATTTTTPTVGGHHHPYQPMTIHEHRSFQGRYSDDEEDDEIPELPVGSPSTPRRRGSTNASVAMLEDGRMSDIILRRPRAASISEEREARSM